MSSVLFHARDKRPVLNTDHNVLTTPRRCRDDLASMFEFSINKTLELVNHQVVEANGTFGYRVTVR